MLKAMGQATSKAVAIKVRLTQFMRSTCFREFSSFPIDSVFPF